MQLAVKHYITTFCSGDYVIAKYLQIKKDGDRYVTCKGYGLPQNKNCFYIFEGEEQVDNKGRKSFFVSSFKMAEPKTKATIRMFFDTDDFLGVGKSLIKKIVELFGEDLFRIIENDPGQLLNVDGMTEQKLKIIVEGYERASNFKKLTNFLAPMGISTRQIKLINDNGIRISSIKSDPFKLMEIKGIGFKTCDTIARYQNVALDSPERIRGGIVETMQEFALEGNTCCNDSRMIDRAIFKLNDGLHSRVVTKKLVIDAVMSLINDNKLVVENSHDMYLSEYYRAEKDTAVMLGNILHNPVQDKYELINALSEYQGSLSAGQKEACSCSLSNRISVITGGAGTGKTTIINALIKAYSKVYPNREVTLLAPTGKAARRISQASGYYASTIHSRLQLYDGTDMPEDFIPSGLVIVDEFSMVDQLLFEKLVMALRPSCHLIMIGDINQLPSVGAGACLKDLIESEAIPVSYLTEIFRQNGGTIVDNSIKIIRKDYDLRYDEQMMFVRVKDESEALRQICRIYSWYADREGIDKVALISPLRSSQNGRFSCVSDELNGTLQEYRNSSEVSYAAGSVTFRLNDRVMCWKNTPEVSNGDVGTIVELDIDNDEWGMEMTISWENGYTGVYHKKDLESFTLAYAMSVHKSQGSEYDTIVIPIIKEQKCRLFRNNLLYTAITRAKKRCIIVSDDQNYESIRYMIAHSETNTRMTGFKEKLQRYCVL